MKLKHYALNTKQKTQISKFLSLVLRHAPEKIGIKLDEAGWTPIDDLIVKMNTVDQIIDRQVLQHIVATNNKKRFAISEDGQMIRANQGHSIKVEHGYMPKAPPPKLFHGTASRNTESILNSGLDKKDRHHVHLSSEIKTAIEVGKRYGKPVVFDVDSGQMHNDGIEFFQSENGVWLTDCVPTKYLTINESNG